MLWILVTFDIGSKTYPGYVDSKPPYKTSHDYSDIFANDSNKDTKVQTTDMNIGELLNIKSEKTDIDAKKQENTEINISEENANDNIEKNTDINVEKNTKINIGGNISKENSNINDTGGNVSDENTKINIERNIRDKNTDRSVQENTDGNIEKNTKINLEQDTNEKNTNIDVQKISMLSNEHEKNTDIDTETSVSNAPDKNVGDQYSSN